MVSVCGGVHTFKHINNSSNPYTGCPQCYPARTQQLAAGRTAEQLYYQTKLRLWELETRHGYQLHIVWGHELAERLKREPDTRLLWHTQVLDSVARPLDPREDALRGGRTEPFRLHYVCSEEEEIICIDIVRRVVMSVTL
jgi:hypothetical protein